MQIRQNLLAAKARMQMYEEYELAGHDRVGELEQDDSPCDEAGLPQDMPGSDEFMDIDFILPCANYNGTICQSDSDRTY